MAGVPEEIMFATKLQQAAVMVKNALELGVRARWFAGDEVYSGRELRRNMRELGLGYAVGVSQTYTVMDGAGRRWKARQMVNKVQPHQWMRMRTGHGTKGTREYDWAWLDVRADDAPDGHGDDGTSVLVARRHRYTGEISFFRCWSPEDVTLAHLVEVICRRWRIEETFQLGKTFTGLDEGQVTCWNSWMRWSLFSLVASAVLALTAAATTTVGPARRARLVPLTCPDLVRLLRVSSSHHQSGTRNTSALDGLAPSPSSHRTSLPRVDTLSRTSHNQNYSCRGSAGCLYSPGCVCAKPVASGSGSGTEQVLRSATQEERSLPEWVYRGLEIWPDNPAGGPPVFNPDFNDGDPARAFKDGLISRLTDPEKIRDFSISDHLTGKKDSPWISTTEDLRLPLSSPSETRGTQGLTP